MSDKRDWQADGEFLKKTHFSLADMEELALEITPHWHQEAEKWRTETFRQHPTQDAYDAACAALHKHRERADRAEQERDSSRAERKQFNQVYEMLLKRFHAAEAREQKLKEARPIDQWHEDIGDVLWWSFPIEESPYCGSPLDSDWPDYHTHWTPIFVPEKFVMDKEAEA